ncbi:MAG: site-2 protease family protein [Endomicrobium sp.]|jgi:Zn-dependent protease|nr:site-2 protease family protein [Endomicrobium sp.]
MAVFEYVVILLFSVIIHEVAHGYVAHLRGDDTAKMAGRITLNPISHIELFGSILFPVMLLLLKTPILFGWARPVPLNYKNLKNPRADIPLVSLAGPASNILLAFLSGLGIRLIKVFPSFELGFGWAIKSFLYAMLIVNIVLAVINLIPIPPFDGSKIVTYFLPEKIAVKYLNLNPYICLIMLFVILSSKILWRFIYPIVNFFVVVFSGITF